MASFNGKAFEKKLKEMDASQTSIQTVSLWIIHHRQVGKQVVSAWANFLKKSKPERRLLLLYLANDVVQNGRKKAKELIQLFGKSLKDCMQLLADPSIKNSVGRVLNIWEERKIYEKDFISKLRSVLAGKTEKSEHQKGNKKPKVTKEIPPDYKLSKVINGIRHMKELESSMSKKTSQLSLLKVDASDIEAVKQVKDRFGVDKFCREFEESRAKLEDYCNTLSRCLNDKRVLVTTLQGCDAFYEAATEEANIIVTAYKTFGNRLISMKKKLNSKVRRLEEKSKRQQKKGEVDQEEDTVGSAESEKEKGNMEESQESKTEGEKKDRSESIESSTPLTSDDVTPTPTGEEDGDQKDEDEDNRKVEDMELDSDSDAEVSSGEGPLYDPTSAGHGFEESDFVKTEVDTVLSELKESEPVESEVTVPLEQLPVPLEQLPVPEKDPFSALVNLPGLAALKTGMMTALPLTQVNRSPSMSPASDFAPSPEGTPEDLVLQVDSHSVINFLPSAPELRQPLPQGMTFDSLFTEDASEASLEQPLDSTLGGSSSQATIGKRASGSVSAPSNNTPNKFDLLSHSGRQTLLVPMVTTKGSDSATERLSYSATRISQSLVDHSSQSERYGDTMLTFPSQQTWGRNVPLPHEPVTTQSGNSGLAHSSVTSHYRGLEYSSDTRPAGAGIFVAEQNAKVVHAEAILAEAENAPSPAPSGGSTPTQDERLETPVVRPMDVLTQLINRARGLQDTLKGPEISLFSNNDHPKPNSGVPPSNPMEFGPQGMGSVGKAQQPYAFNNPPPVLSPGPPRGFPPISASSSFIPNPSSGYLKRYDAPLLPSDSFGDLQSSSSGAGGVKPYHDGLEGSQLPLSSDDRPLPFTKFPVFDQIEIVKGQGPNGVFLDDGTSLMHQAARLEEGDSRLLQDGVSLSPRTQFLQGASSKDVDGSSSSDESVGKHHRSRKRSSRSKDRSPRHRSSKHRDSVAKHKEGSKHRERSPKHRSPKRRERHHSPKQKERSPKHASKRRKHSNSKGRDSHSPDREKYSSLRRRDRSPSLELSRSSNEDVFYNDRRSPTPELDSLPVRTPVSPRNVRSFDALPNTQASSLDLNLGTPQLPIFSPSSDLLLPSPSASAFGQGYQSITPTLPSLGPPRGPFVGGPDPNQNTGINDSPVQPRLPLEQASVTGQPIPQPADPGFLGPPSFNRQLSDGRFPHHDHARQDNLESRYPMQLEPQTGVRDSRGAPIAPETEPSFRERHEKQQMTGANLSIFSRSHEVVNSKVSIDSAQPMKRGNLEPSASYASQERSEETHSLGMPGNEELRGNEAILQQDRISIPHIGRQTLDHTTDHIFEGGRQFMPTAAIRPRPPLEGPFQQPPPRLQGDRHRFGLPRMPRPDHSEVRFEHPGGQSEMRFRPRNEGGEPRFLNRGEPFSPRFLPRHDFLDPRFAPRNDFQPRLGEGLGFRKGFPRFQGQHPPRGPRMPPNRFPRQPFPRGPDRPFAPRGPVY